MKIKETDYYRLLDLNKDATEEEIKKAYRRLAFQYHPDHNPMDEEAEEKFKQISESYAVLGDAEKRRVYDQFGYAGFRKRYSSEDIFSFRSGCTRNMRGFGRGMGCGRRGRFWKDASYHFSELNNFIVDGSVVYAVDITTEEAISGTERVVLTRTRLGDKTHQLTIPAGISNGDKIKLTLKDADQNVLNLYIQIHVKEQ